MGPIGAAPKSAGTAPEERRVGAQREDLERRKIIIASGRLSVLNAKELLAYRLPSISSIVLVEGARSL